MMQRRTNTLLHTFRTEGTKAQTSSDVSDVCMHTKSDKQDHRETSWDGVFAVLECMAPALGCLGVLVGPGCAPIATVWAFGGASYFGPGWVRAMPGGICCVELCVMGTGRMQMLWPGRWVAGCGSCRRLQLVAVVWCCWPALGD